MCTTSEGLSGTPGSSNTSTTTMTSEICDAAGLAVGEATVMGCSIYTKPTRNETILPPSSLSLSPFSPCDSISSRLVSP